MHFIVIMAFALLLSDGLPPDRLDLLAGADSPTAATLLLVAAQLVIITFAAAVANRRTLAALAGDHGPFDHAANTFSSAQRLLLGMIAATLVVTMVMTPWTRLVREGWGLARFPLLDDGVIMTPFVLSLILVWTVQFPAELKIRSAATEAPADEDPAPSRPPHNDATAALAAARGGRANPTQSLATYLIDKLRHQFLIIAVPMTVIVFAKHFTDRFQLDLAKSVGVPWASDSLLGCVSVCVLAFAPIMLRYIWATEPLPDGPLRHRLVRICDRIGLRYREILLWHTHGLAINAAVMGFIGPLRYILVSDALLETMDDEQIEAVFGHEAGHVRHRHLQFFLVFVLLSMYASGGVLELLRRRGLVTDPGMMQIIALGVLLTSWLLGFGWVSRQFERQADLFGVRSVTPDLPSCTGRCTVHGADRPAGICTTAAQLFGRTLLRIADLNGIPRDAPSWRHGSIQSRCRLLEHLASNPEAVTRFDRRLRYIKIGLTLLALTGTAIAAWLYAADILRALRL